MGKQKRNRRRKARAARAPVPVTLVSAEEQFEEQTKTKVTPLVQQMTSGTSTARMVACDAVASMVTEDKGHLAVKLLISSGALKPLLTLAVSPEAGVRVAATGALRNLAAVSVDACQALMQADALSIVFGLLPKDPVAKWSLESHIACTTNLVAFLTSLSENVDVVLERFTQQATTLLPALFHYLQPSQSSAELCAEIASLLHVVTEGNADLSSTILSNEAMCQHLVKLCTANDVSAHTRVLIAGTLSHLALYGGAYNVLPGVVAVLSTALDIDHVSLFAGVVEHVGKAQQQQQAQGPVAPQASEEEDKMMEEESDTVVQVATSGDDVWTTPLATWQDSTRAVESSLEMLSNLCVDAGDDSAEHKSTPPASAAFASAASTDNAQLQQTLQLMQQAGCFDKATSKAPQFLGDDAMKAARSILPDEQVKQCLRSASRVRQRALACMNNMLMTFPDAALGSLQQLWGKLFQLLGFSLQRVSSQLNGTDQSMCGDTIVELTNIITLLWAILRKDASVNVSKSQLDAVVQCCKLPAPLARPVHVQLAGLLGAMGSPTKSDLLKLNYVIGASLLQLLEGSATGNGQLGDAQLQVELASEALLAVFDVYAEDNMHTVTLGQLKLLDKLRAFTNVFNDMVQQVAPTLPPQVALRVKEAHDNLQPFIDYKTQNP